MAKVGWGQNIEMLKTDGGKVVVGRKYKKT